ncbi:MAG TPA: nucleotidyltransferase family protein [Gemmatimonadaceae bacterium]
MIPAIVLAAGRSSRFGRAKALLPDEAGQPFAARLAASFKAGGAEGLVLVSRPDDEDLHRAIEPFFPFARIVENADPDRGQLSSLLEALDAVDRPGVRGIMVTLVDMPLVQPSTIARLRDVALHGAATIVRPVHHGRHGHPVVFMRATFDALRRADPSQGAKAVVRAHPVVDVAVDDRGVIEDVDTPDDYARVFGRAPK